MRENINNLLGYIGHLICKVSEWIGAAFSYILFQLGIPLELHALDIGAEMVSVLHGFVSMMVPVGTYFIIHISKELMKDKTSWLSVSLAKAVYVSSFKWLKKDNNNATG